MKIHFRSYIYLACTRANKNEKEKENNTHATQVQPPDFTDPSLLSNTHVWYGFSFCLVSGRQVDITYV